MLTFAAFTAFACNVIDLTAEPDALDIFKLSVESGSGETAAAGATIRTVAVLVPNGSTQVIGNGQNALVKWTVTSGGGTVAVENDFTDLVGKTAAVWTLGPQPGLQTLTATVGTRSGPQLEFVPSSDPQHTVTFTATALLTLIVCLGANTSILSIVRSVVLKSLPFPEADRVVLMSNLYP